MVILLRVRLAVDSKEPVENRIQAIGKDCWPFWLIFIMAMPAAVSTTILAVLLPTVLNELGFELTFGGYSTTLFGLGGAAGSFVWAYIARKKDGLCCTIAALFLTLPFLLAYLVLINTRVAIWLLLGAGFSTVAAYTLMITLSRHATGPTLGRRLGVMVGGTWAVAYIIFQALLLIAEHFQFGTRALLNLTPWGYLFSGLFGIFIMLKFRHTSSAEMSGPSGVQID
jgi:MFS family permease